MDIRSNLHYTKTHEWLHKKNELYRIGISDYAQDTLTDIVFVELPSVGATVKKGDTLATLESVKSVAEVYSPLSGTIENVNQKLNDDPGLVNSSPYDEGWLIEIKADNENEAKDFLSSDEYIKMLE